MEDVPSVCERIGVALEILDSRYVGFKYFSLPDVVADNASSSHFVLGDSVRFSDIGLARAHYTTPRPMAA